jgi:hypothetical protein
MGEHVHGENIRHEAPKSPVPLDHFAAVLVDDPPGLLLRQRNDAPYFSLLWLVPVGVSLGFISINLPDAFAFPFGSSFASYFFASSLAPGSSCISFVFGAFTGWMSIFSAGVTLSLESFALTLDLVGLRALSRQVPAGSAIVALFCAFSSDGFAFEPYRIDAILIVVLPTRSSSSSYIHGVSSLLHPFVGCGIQHTPPRVILGLAQQFLVGLLRLGESWSAPQRSKYS